MDPYDDPQWKPILDGQNVKVSDPESVRKAMGEARKMAGRVNLARLRPSKDLASTGYCLADPGEEYVVYQPEQQRKFTVELPKGDYQFEWFDPGQGTSREKGVVRSTHGKEEFSSPLQKDGILLLKRSH